MGRGGLRVCVGDRATAGLVDVHEERATIERGWRASAQHRHGREIQPSCLTWRFGFFSCTAAAVGFGLTVQKKTRRDLGHARAASTKSPRGAGTRVVGCPGWGPEREEEGRAARASNDARVGRARHTARRRERSAERWRPLGKGEHCEEQPHGRSRRRSARYQTRPDENATMKKLYDPPVSGIRGLAHYFATSR